MAWMSIMDVSGEKKNPLTYKEYSFVQEAMVAEVTCCASVFDVYF